MEFRSKIKAKLNNYKCQGEKTKVEEEHQVFE